MSGGRRHRNVAAAARGTLAPLALGALLAAPSTGAAQDAPDLDRVEAAADSGRADSARAMLDRWFEARGGEAGREAEGRARFLRARLTSDADSAADLYLRVAMDDAAGVGDRAWLRLAQLRVAGGEPERAIRVLDRLRSDYPATDLTAESWLWTGHARRAAGRADGACAAWRRAAEAAGSPDGELGRRARDALSACGADGSAAAAGPETAAPGDSASSGWAVQVGAFRDRAGAESLRRAVGERVPDADLVIVPPGPGEELFRVRTRSLGDRADARRLADELESRRLSAIVVRTDP